MFKELTEKQKTVLLHVQEFIAENSYPPTLRELADKLGITFHAVRDHLLLIQKKGYISMDPKKSRTIKIIREV